MEYLIEWLDIARLTMLGASIVMLIMSHSREAQGIREKDNKIIESSRNERIVSKTFLVFSVIVYTTAKILWSICC